MVENPKKSLKSKKNMFENNPLSKVETTKKKHKRSSSNVEEFAFNSDTKNDDDNFNSIYDELISGFKSDCNVKKEEPKKEKRLRSKNKSDGQLNVNTFKKEKIKGNQSTLDMNPLNDLDSMVTQVQKNNTADEKIDIQTLTNIEEIKDYYEYTENCLQLISKLEMPPIEEISHLQLDLPEKLLKKKLAIFDLDETLIHCELKKPQNAEKLITIKLPNGNKARVSIKFKYRLD